MTNSIGEIGDAACILSIGSNTTVAHPVIGVEVKRALRQGGKLIVANPREIDLCKEADIWLRQRSGSDVALLMGMMWVIVDEGLLDLSFVQERCENFEAFLDALKDFHPGYVEGITGVKRDEMVAAARMYATHKPASILYTMGITQHTHGTDNVMALANLAMLTGNIGKASSGLNPLRGQNNVQGACDMGSLPTVYPGYQSVADEGIQKKFEGAWGVSLSNRPGRVLGEIIEGAGRGEVKAVYLIGENPVLSDPDAKHVEGALQNLEFLVVQDIFLTETAKLADVVLPAASFAEKEGTFTNTERRVQRVRKVVEAVGEAKADWWIVSQVAQKMGGKGFEWGSAEEVMEEVVRLTPSYGGITYKRIEGGGIQWPCPTVEHPGTKYLHRETFTRGKGKFAALKYRPSAEEPDAEYPLILTTERSLYQYHTGTMTRKVEGLRQLRGEELVEINPEDAGKLGVKDGERVKVISRRGEVEAKAKVTEVSPVGVVSMTFHFAESPTNVITNPAIDPVAKIPELKVAAVRVVPVKT